MAQLEETRKDDLAPREDQDSEEGQERDESLSGDRVTALRQLIDAHLRKNNVYEDIRKFVAGMGAEEGKVDSFDALRERKVIERVIRSLETQPAGQSASRTPSLKHAVKPGAQYLLVKVTGGRGFSETRSEANDDRQFVLCMHYGQQRFVADPVSCAQEPALDASFLVQISDQISFASSSPERQAQAVRELLQESSALQGLHFLIMRTRKSAIDSAKDLVASHVLEWRRLLASASGAATVAVELHATGEAAKVRVPAGILDLRLELVPARPRPSPLTDEKLLTSLRANTKQAGQAYRQFCEYARAWWEEFVELDDRFRHRLVKIFAENEWGDHEPVFAFVRPMRAGRLLASARHAARFVSLIPYTREEMVGGSRLEVWHVAHTFLSKGRGDCEDHAVLLCNLLLGFGLNAFVCMGTVQDSLEEPERDHVWCMTLSGKDNRICTFWESLTGHRVIMAPRRDVESAAQTALRQSYRRIACAFNHESFYANKQRDDRTEHCSFNVLDDMRWKAMDERLIAAIQKRPVVPLRAPTIPEHERSDEIEIALRELVAAERAQQLDLDTRWDADLGDYLAPALCAYETERLTGVLAGNEDFQAAIRGHVPPGHSFKAFPTLLKTMDPHKILHALRKSTVASELLHTRADHTHFALRVMVLPFPEDVVAVWVMLAVRFRAS